MRILVTGARGQLGSDVCRELSQRSFFDVKGIGHQELDITKEEAVKKYVETFVPDAIIHCAAYTAVDKAETEPDLCRRVNALGTKYLAEAASKIKAKFLYISTDYVFDGNQEKAYIPEDIPNPKSVYGTTKAEGERYVKALLNQYFIVRISWVFGKNGNNFIKTMLNLAKTKKELSVVYDQIGSPTYTVDLAKLLVDMILTDRYGIYHATNEGFCSWYEFACEIFRLSGIKLDVHPVTTKEYRTLAPQQALRPMNSRMDKSKLESQGFSRLPDWHDALSRFLMELKRE